MKWFSALAVCLAFAVSYNEGAKILGMFPFPGTSHFNMFKRIMVELAKRGHEVDVVTHFPLKEKVPGYNEINIRGSTPIFTNNLTIEMGELSYTEMLKAIANMVGGDICIATFNTKQMQELRDSNKKYDVVISELFSTDCMLGWAWKFGAHSIAITSSEQLPWTTDRFGLPNNPSYITSYFVDYNSRMTLYERMVNTWTLVKGNMYYYMFNVKHSQRIAREFFGEDLPDLNVLAYNTTLQLVNTHFSISNSRPLVPNVVEVAGVHIENPKPVDKHFDKILETDTQGIIYVCTGSLVKSESFPSHVLQAMFDALSKMPYKVLWKATQENFPTGLNFSSNIHFEPWTPQLDILCDPRVKLFVSHGGLMGTLESVHCGVPILGIPIFADQIVNLKRVEVAGYGLRMKLNSINVNNFEEALKKLLFDPIYMKKVKSTSAMFKDRVLGPLETSVYWIEYIIRHNGAPQLQSAAKDLYWYQYYLIDVIAVVLVAVLTIIYAFYIVIKFLVQKFTRKSKLKSS